MLAGLVAHFKRGGVGETWGAVDLPNGRRGRYKVRRAPKAPSGVSNPSRLAMLNTKISVDLLPDGADVQIGLMGADMLASLRQVADFHLPSTFPFPRKVEPIPFVTMTPANRDFEGVADRIRCAKPFGATVIPSPEGPMLTIMGERAGFAIADDEPPITVWKRNIQNSDGAQVLIVTDGVVNQEEPDPDRPGAGAVGRIYGLFECRFRGSITKPAEARRRES